MSNLTLSFPILYLTSKRNQIILLLIIWATVQLYLYFSTGIQPVLESLKYIGAAEHLLNTGSLPEKRYFFYLTTTLTIAACLKTGVGFTGVVIIQLLFNLLASLSFYNALHRLQNQSMSAFITTLLLLLCLPYQIWNFYLYTESLFYSFTLLFFSSCLRQHLKISLIALQFMLLSLAVLSRPLGILLLPCWTLFLIAQAPKKIRLYLFGALLLTGIVVIFVVNLILGNISDWQVLKPAEYHYIICDIPTGITLLPDTIKSQPPLSQLFLYIKSYPAQFLSLALKRLNAFFFLTRPYYSPLHNVYLVFFCATLYIPIFFYLCLIITKKFNNIKGIYISLLIILFFSLAICLQCDDYHNRFHHALIPVFLFLGSFKFLDMLNLKKRL